MPKATTTTGELTTIPLVDTPALPKRKVRRCHGFGWHTTAENGVLRIHPKVHVI